jgi:hypothetical protein
MSSVVNLIISQNTKLTNHGRFINISLETERNLVEGADITSELYTLYTLCSCLLLYVFVNITVLPNDLNKRHHACLLDELIFKLTFKKRLKRHWLKILTSEMKLNLPSGTALIHVLKTCYGPSLFLFTVI